MSVIKSIEDIINEVCEDKGLKSISLEDSNSLKVKLREDIGLDSFDLAQLTVLIEDEFDVDVFEDGIVETVEEIINKIQ